MTGARLRQWECILDLEQTPGPEWFSPTQEGMRSSLGREEPEDPDASLLDSGWLKTSDEPNPCSPTEPCMTPDTEKMFNNENQIFGALKIIA